MGINQVDDLSLSLYQAKLVPIRRPTVILCNRLNNKDEFFQSSQPAGEGVSSRFPRAADFAVVNEFLTAGAHRRPLSKDSLPDKAAGPH
jgi:hypothetical protein